MEYKKCLLQYRTQRNNLGEKRHFIASLFCCVFRKKHLFLSLCHFVDVLSEKNTLVVSTEFIYTFTDLLIIIFLSGPAPIPNSILSLFPISFHERTGSRNLVSFHERTGSRAFATFLQLAISFRYRSKFLLSSHLLQTHRTGL